MDTKIAFQLLKFLKENSNISISQEFKFNSKDENNNSKLLHKHVETTLIGIDYTLKVNDIISQEFLIFATPLEHLLQCSIILPPNSKILRIEYDNCEKLIYFEHLNYLQRKYTILEEIEVELFEDFPIISHVNPIFNLFLPYQDTSILNEIIISKFASNTSILCTPHLNPNHLTFIEQLDLKLFDIFRCREYNELIHKYFNYTINHINKEFQNAPVIDFAQTSYPMYYFFNEKSNYSLNNLAQLQVDTQININLHTNSKIPVISSTITKYPLPIFINSKNEYVSIENANHFVSITGINFSYHVETIKSLLVKDKFSKNSLFCNFYIVEEAAQILQELSFEEIITQQSELKISYTNAKEYFIKNALIQNRTSKNFKPNISKKQIKIALDEFLIIISKYKELCIKLASFPKVELQSNFSKSIISLTYPLIKEIESKKFNYEHQFQLIIHSIFSFKKINTNISLTQKELFELSLFIQSISFLLNKLKNNFEDKIILNKISKIEEETKIIQSLFNPFKYLNLEFISQNYDEKECRKLLLTLYQTIISIPLLKNQICYFSTNIDEIKELLHPFAHELNNEEINSKIEHSKIISNSEFLTLIYY